MATRRFTSVGDMIHLLPPDARLLIAQFAPHPAVDVLWTSRRWLRLWGIANDWFADWQERRDLMLRRGLPVHIEGAVLDKEFFSVHITISEDYLIRSHAARGFQLHLTLGFRSDWGAGIAEDAMVRINRRWSGRDAILHISWMGCGGAAFLDESDELAQDWDISWLHSRGWYSDRGLHISL